MTTPLDPRHEAMLHAVRSDDVVGRGSGSVIDETLGNSDLIEMFACRGFTKVQEALDWAHAYQEAWETDCQEQDAVWLD